MAHRSVKFENIADDRSVVQIALDVHMTTVGSSERNPDDQARDVIALREVIDEWKEPTSLFDIIVKALIGQAILDEDEK